MKTVKLISIVLAGVMLVFSACKKDNGKEPSPAGNVTDACGITYPIVKIGEQYWMAENLRCNKYANLSEAYNASWLTNNTIPTSDNRIVFTPYYTDASDRSNWNSFSKIFGMNLTDAQVAKLGYLYNWAAAVGVADGRKQATVFSGTRQGICPNGWHIPSRAEWQTLEDYIENADGKGTDTAGKHLKTNYGWYDGADNCKPGLDTYGFVALPPGYANGSSVYNVGCCALFWTATAYESNSYDAYSRYLSFSDDFLLDCSNPENRGQSVRCLKD